MTFDTTVDLAFGCSFDSINTEEKAHPWIVWIKKSIISKSKYCGIRELLSRPTAIILDQLLAKLSAKAKKSAHAYTDEMVRVRMDSKEGRADWMSAMIQ